MSAPVSASAFFQSIMPAPVLSRRSFTMLAVISAMGDSLLLVAGTCAANVKLV
jgi:hypothetical protein